MTDYITTEELMRQVEKLGFTCRNGAFRLFVEDNNCTIANVSLNQPLQVDTCYDSLNHKNPTHVTLYELMNRYWERKGNGWLEFKTAAEARKNTMKLKK